MHVVKLVGGLVAIGAFVWFFGNGPVGHETADAAPTVERTGFVAQDSSARFVTAPAKE